MTARNLRVQRREELTELSRENARLSKRVRVLEDAQQWRPLTDDPKTWPDIERRVLFRWRASGSVSIGERVDMAGRVLWDGCEHNILSATHWLPLPEPPEAKQ